MISPDYCGITVSSARVLIFRQKFGDLHLVKAEAGKYIALYHPYVSWPRLSRLLYEAGETVAVGIAKLHLQTVTGDVYILTTLRFTSCVRKCVNQHCVSYVQLGYVQLYPD